MRRENRKDDAVSPVIGVMLMLVVTVVIAAVVVGFSTGLAGSSSTTPTALYEVSDVETWRGMGVGEELAYLNIRQKGGDSIPLDELQITLESVGGMNSGITQIFVAKDSMNSVDMGVGVWEEAPDFMTQMYQDSKNQANIKIAEYKVFLEKLGLDSNKYGNLWSYNQDGFSELDDFIWNNYEEDDYWEFDDITYSISSASWYASQVEREGWIISENNEVLGKIGGGSAYSVSVLGQGKPTESVVSTGDIIHIVPFDGSSLNTRIFEGTSVKWTISYIPTNSVIAKGEFEVIAD